MNWLIVEDSLKNKQGHWGEYVCTFREGLTQLGDTVQVLCDHQAEPWLVEKFDAMPVLPASIWHRVSDGAPKWKRLLRIPVHAWQTYSRMRAWFRKHPASGVIFVPTVLVHHLLGWWALISGPLRHSKATVLLFFPNTPVRLEPANGRGYLPKEPTARLFGFLIRKLAGAVRDGRVVLGAETASMRKALEEATGVPFVYLPHPVPSFAQSDTSPRPFTMAVYGPARHEKGSDVLQQAIEKHFEAFPESKTRFVIQWLDDFQNDHGKPVGKSPALLGDARVEYVTAYFAPGEYARRLGQTDTLLLPYRLSSYDLRVSRIVIEAMVHGIPVIATRGTTLEDQTKTHGACLSCEDGCVESLAAAIRTAETDFARLQETAMERKTSALAHFSVSGFRELLLVNHQGAV